MPIALDRVSSTQHQRTTSREVEGHREEEELQRESALSQVFRLLNTLSQLMQQNKREFLDVVRSDLKSYQEESNNLSLERTFQGWSVASLTLAGATLMGASALVKEISEMGPMALDFIDSLGGVASVEKLCTASSQFSEGMKPVTNAFSDSRITTKETNRQILQIAHQRGQQAADQGNATIEKLISAALRLYETDARSKA